MQHYSATHVTESSDRAGPSADPFGVELPEGWTRTVDAERTVYEADGAGVRVEIRELSRRLSIYWWVDVYERAGDEWKPRDVGVADTFQDPDAAAAAAQAVVRSAAADRRPSEMNLVVHSAAAVEADD